MDKRIGAQFFTIKEFCKTLEDFEESCRKVSEIGYKVIQLSGIGDFEAEDIKKIIDKYGLEVACTHRPSQNYLENLEKEIEFHKTLGIKIAGLGSMPGFDAKEETVEDFIKNYKRVAEELKKHDIIFAYHNHDFEFEKRDGRHVFDRIVEGMDSDNFQLILDVHWIARAGLDVVKFIRDHKDMIACVHYKDFKVVNREPLFEKVGYGNMNWDGIIEACEESSAQFALVEQDKCYDEDPFECLKESYNYLVEKGYN